MARLIAALAAIFLLLASTAFAAEPWNDYQIIMWQPQTPAAYAALRSIGVTAAMLETNRATGLFRAEERGTLKAVHLRFYLENIATDFYSPYHRFEPDKPVNWRFRDLKARWQQTPDDTALLMREPGLDDPQWLARVSERLTRDVMALATDKPLFFNLADEAGIADLSAAWDFDWSPRSLAGFRQWLRESYSTLDSLNAEWGTRYQSWEAVMPTTTDAAMRRRDGNYAQWSDFKAWMEVAFARAVAAGTQAIHQVDPAQRSAIEGAQMPGWGGWNYARLAGTTDVMESYDLGDSLDIMRSLAPQTVMLTTTAGGPAETWNIWRELLRGTRGLVLWDETGGIAGADGRLGRRGVALEPTFAEFTGGLGALLTGAERQDCPVAILYSQASFRIQWMLDHKALGTDWVKRTASDENADTAIRVAVRVFVALLTHQGVTPCFVSSAEIEEGALASERIRVVLLPDAVAISRKEAEAIRGFVAKGGLVVADGMPGRYDGHGRRLAKPLIDDLFAAGGTPAQGGVFFATGRILGSHSDAFTALLASRGVTPWATVGAGDVETYLYHCGEATILAVMRDAPGADAETVAINLPRAMSAFDLRGERALGRSGHLTIAVPSDAPAILALFGTPPPPPAIDGPRRLARGVVADFNFPAAARGDVIHVDFIGPDGLARPDRAANLRAPDGGATLDVAFAAGDTSGTWTIRARDMLTGEVASAPVEVVP